MFLRKIFGGSDENKTNERKPIESKSSPIDALSKLKKTTETLEKRKTHLNTKIAEFMKKAREKMKKGDKRGAMMLLKKKKMYEKEITKIEGSQINMEQQIITIEGMYTNKLVFDNLKNTNNCIKNLHNTMDIEDVEELHDDINEAMENSNEISELMSRPIGEEYDEDELLEELTIDSMTQLDELPNVNTNTNVNTNANANVNANVNTEKIVLNLPEAPTSKLENNNSLAKDKELAELEALMA